MSNLKFSEKCIFLFSKRQMALVDFVTHLTSSSFPSILYRSGEKFVFSGSAFADEYHLSANTIRQTRFVKNQHARDINQVAEDISYLLKKYGFKVVEIGK